MNTLHQTSDFAQWVKNLPDKIVKAKVIARIRSAMNGNFGDCKPVGEGISEMRIHCGAGYRIYFTRIRNTVYLLLAGGDKSTQQKDIAKAKRLAQEIKESKQ